LIFYREHAKSQFCSDETYADRDATNPSKDPLNGIEGPMNKSKSKRMNQALQGLIIKINEK